MSKITIKGFIRANLTLESWQRGSADVVDGVYYRFSPYDGDDGSSIVVCPHELTFDPPADWPPAKAQIAALRAEKAELIERHQARIAEIDERVMHLQAVSYGVQA